MMHTGSRQMSQPPNHQKEDTEHMIHTIQTTNMALFPIPSTTFEVLKGGFDPPTEQIIGDALATRWQIGVRRVGAYGIPV
jgi:hypothetical protein